MKISVSISDGDLATLDRFVEHAGLESRSAAIQQAIRRLPHPALETAYAEAWDEWEESGDAELWASATNDGLTDDPR